MTAIVITRALLVADTAFIALVPSSRVFSNIVPLATVKPYVCINEISRVDDVYISGQSKGRSTSRIQVTIIATSYSSQKAILGAVRHACRDKSGVVNGIPGVSVLLDGTGPDFIDTTTLDYMQTQDFKVTYTEAT